MINIFNNYQKNNYKIKTNYYKTFKYLVKINNYNNQFLN